MYTHTIMIIIQIFSAGDLIHTLLSGCGNTQW